MIFDDMIQQNAISHDKARELGLIPNMVNESAIDFYPHAAFWEYTFNGIVGGYTWKEKANFDTLSDFEMGAEHTAEEIWEQYQDDITNWLDMVFYIKNDKLQNAYLNFEKFMRKNPNERKHAVLYPQVKLVLDVLVETGHITQEDVDEGAFCEYQGWWEFKNISICFGLNEETPEGNWLNLLPDGHVEKY